MYPICYLAVSGFPLSEDVNLAIYITAIGMAHSHSKCERIKTDQCEGIITSQFKYVCLGSIAGTQFNAELDTEQGTTKVSFIAQTQDIDEIDFEKLGFSQITCKPGTSFPSREQEQEPTYH